MSNIRLMPDEPTRFTPVFMDKMLEHAESLNASDITIQTGEPIFAEVYGKLIKITNRRLSNTELGDLINAIYGLIPQLEKKVHTYLQIFN